MVLRPLRAGLHRCGGPGLGASGHGELRPGPRQAGCDVDVDGYQDGTQGLEGFLVFKLDELSRAARLHGRLPELG